MGKWEEKNKRTRRHRHSTSTMYGEHASRNINKIETFERKCSRRLIPKRVRVCVCAASIRMHTIEVGSHACTHDGDTQTHAKFRSSHCYLRAHRFKNANAKNESRIFTLYWQTANDSMMDEPGGKCIHHQRKLTNSRWHCFRQIQVYSTQSTIIFGWALMANGVSSTQTSSNCACICEFISFVFRSCYSTQTTGVWVAIVCIVLGEMIIQIVCVCVAEFEFLFAKNSPCPECEFFSHWPTRTSVKMNSIDTRDATR